MEMKKKKKDLAKQAGSEIERNGSEWRGGWRPTEEKNKINKV